jgi:hypothetical protein
MDSKDAARLAFGNPGFLDFLNNIPAAILSGVSPGYGIVKATQTAIPFTKRFTEPVTNLAESLVSSIPGLGTVTSFFDSGINEDDGSGPNAINDADDEDEGFG